MKRRLLLSLPLAVAGCSVLPNRPYQPSRQWPLVVRRPVSLPPRRNGPVLLVRSVQAGPGLDVRGLKTLEPDGSMQTAYYEEWIVPPAQAVEDSLRQWLAASGLFQAVVSTGSRLSAQLVLESELDALWAEPGRHVARATISYSVLDQRGISDKVRLQRVATATAPLTSDDPPSMVAAEKQALAEVFSEIEHSLTRLR